MRLVLLSLIFSFFFSFSASAQLTDGSLAPDFTEKDLNGDFHTLYDILDQGKIVILDLYATWCGPCWSYHQTHALEDAFQAYGPNGTDELFVFGIEGDAGTNVECIYGPTGCNDFTLGDWTEGISYPMMDNRGIATSYALTYFPTVYMIYPDRTTREIRSASFEQIREFMDEIPQLSAGVNPVIFEAELPEGSFCDGEKTVRPEFLIQNMGEEMITSGDISFLVNGQVQYSQAWEGELAPYQMISDLEIPSVTITENSTLELRMDNFNGDPAMEIVYSKDVLLHATNKIKVSIQTDGNASSDFNNFILQNDNGSIAFEDISQNNTLYEFEYDLDVLGCHVFIIFDNGGDGIDGDITIEDSAGNIIYENRPEFTSSDAASFNASQTSSIEVINVDSQVSVYPNPTQSVLNVDLETKDKVTYEVSDLGGKQMLLGGMNSGSNQIEVGALNGGMYILTVNAGDKTYVKKFVVE